MILLGLDPGVTTGYAVWSKSQQKLLVVESRKLHEVLRQLWVFVKNPHKADFLDRGELHVFMEDARQRRWFGNLDPKKDRDRLMGAGSIKRDCQIIEDACKDWGIPITLVAPKDNMTKLSAEQFKKLTGWTGRTNEHMRDAAMLVFKR